MVEALRQIHRIVALENKSDAIRQHLLADSRLDAYRTAIEAGEIRNIKAETNRSYTVSEEEKADGSKEKILYLKPEEFQVIEQIVTGKNEGSQQTVRDMDYIVEPTGIINGFTQEEQQIYNAVQSVNDILRRASGRTTSFMSFILSQYLGFDERGYDPFDTILKSPEFTQKFSAYLKLVKSGKKTEAQTYLQKAFENETDSSQKQNIAKLVRKVSGLADFLPRWAINGLPLAFCIQNIAIPFMLRWFKEGTVKNILSFVRGLNPWLDEFAFSHMGIYKSETLNIKDDLDSLSKSNNNSNDNTKAEPKDNYDSIELSNFNSDEYGLKSVLEQVHDGFQRLVGRGNNLSSLVAWLLLKVSGMGNFQKLAGITLKNNSFVKNLYQYLRRISTSAESKAEGSPEPAPAFDRKEERVVAYTVPKIVSVINSLDQSHVDKINSATNWFGRVYSVQYLLMPILTAIVGEKGFIGKTLGVIRDINPILNDAFFDLVATFREELLSIFDIVSNSANIKKLFGEIPIKKGIWGAFANFQSLLSTARGYGHELYNRAAEAFSGSAQPSA